LKKHRGCQKNDDPSAKPPSKFHIGLRSPKTELSIVESNHNIAFRRRITGVNPSAENPPKLQTTIVFAPKQEIPLFAVPIDCVEELTKPRQVCRVVDKGLKVSGCELWRGEGEKRRDFRPSSQIKQSRFFGVFPLFIAFLGG